MPSRIRRVITGHDADGTSIILEDGFSPHVTEMSFAPGLTRTDLWVTDTAPAENAGNEDAPGRLKVNMPPPGGTVFRTVELPPDSTYIEKLRANPQAAFAQTGAAAPAGTPARHPGMHKTPTVDYVIVLAGEVYAVMEKGETLLRAGDVLIQRGANHAWSNRTDKPCVLGVVLVDAKPL